MAQAKPTVSFTLDSGTTSTATLPEPEDYPTGENTTPTSLARRIADRLRAGAVQPDAEELAAATKDAIEIDAANPGRFRSILVVEDERTADNRLITKGATSWRSPPLPLMLMTKTDMGHDGSVVAAVIEKIVRKGNKVLAEGRFDTSPDGAEAARLVANKILTGVSIDGGDAEREILVEEEDDEGFPTKILEKMTALTILGATIVPFPAIGSASIEWIAPDAKASDEDLEAFAADDDCEECQGEIEMLVAAAPIPFPADAFVDPQFKAATPIQVGQDGRVFGHAALFGQCHIGIPGVCTTAPKTKTGYAHFLTGSLPLQEGGYQPVGTITIATSHASDKLGAREAEMHYDHTGAAVAYVNVGEDAFGIWVAGVLKPDITDVQATELCASSLSGDWRKIGGNLELIAILGTNVPGFPVVHLKGDEQMSLVAAGYGPARPERNILAVEADQVAAAGTVEALQAEVADLRKRLERLASQTAPLVLAHLASRLEIAAAPADAEDPVDVEV